jgi:hypothetical protein
MLIATQTLDTSELCLAFLQCNPCIFLCPTPLSGLENARALAHRVRVLCATIEETHVKCAFMLKMYPQLVYRALCHNGKTERWGRLWRERRHGWRDQLRIQRLESGLRI